MFYALAATALSVFALSSAFADVPKKAAAGPLIHCFEPVDHGFNVYVQKEGDSFTIRTTDVTIAEEKELVKIDGAKQQKLDGLLPSDAVGALDLVSGNMAYLRLTEGNGDGESIKWRGELNTVIDGALTHKEALFCKRTDK